MHTESVYKKIPNVFMFDERYRTIFGFIDPFKTLANIIWIGTEKVDGTNTRVMWDGHQISIAGRLETSILPPFVTEYLNSIFLTQEMEYVFEQMFGEKKVTIYGESYGCKVQTNGHKYIADGVGFIVFDITIDGYELNRKNVDDISGRLGLKSVPIVFEGNLIAAKNFISEHPASSLNPEHEMEGLVLTPCVDIYDREGKRLCCKLKYRDMKKCGLCE